MINLSTESLKIRLTGKLASKTILVVFVLVALLEGIARFPLPTENMPPPSTGTYYVLDIKISRLEDYVEKNGGVDVLIFGSSLAHTGIDPEIVEDAFYKATGQNLRVFNFGVTGVSLPPVVSLIEVFTQANHPSLIIHVSEMRDYDSSTGEGMARKVANDPWFHYKLGHFSPFGWLIDNSLALQRYLSFRYWVRDDFPFWYDMLKRRLEDITLWGYEPDRHVDENINEIPDPSNDKDISLLKAYQDYQIDPGRLGYLEEILDRPDTQVLLLEMPVHPTSLAYFGEPQKDYLEFKTTVEKTALEYGGKFISTTDLAIPDEGYSNKFHLNESGSPLLSQFLAEELVELYQSGWYQP